MALSLTTLVNRFYKQQEVVKKCNAAIARAETAKKKEQIKLDRIGNTILDNFTKGKIKGFETKLAKANLKPVEGYNIVDWGKFTAFVHKVKGYELFQRRLNNAAVVERQDDRKGKPLPGVKKYSEHKLVVTKGKGK